MKVHLKTPLMFIDMCCPVQVPLNQLFTDVGHIPRLQPMVHLPRGSDFAVAPLVRASMDGAQVIHSSDSQTAAAARRTSSAGHLGHYG